MKTVWSFKGDNKLTKAHFLTLVLLRRCNSSTVGQQHQFHRVAVIHSQRLALCAVPYGFSFTHQTSTSLNINVAVQDVHHFFAFPLAVQRQCNSTWVVHDVQCQNTVFRNTFLLNFVFWQPGMLAKFYILHLKKSLVCKKTGLPFNEQTSHAFHSFLVLGWDTHFSYESSQLIRQCSKKSLTECMYAQRRVPCIVKWCKAKCWLAH